MLNILRTIECNNQYTQLNFDNQKITDAILACDQLNHYQTPSGELSIVFVDDATIASIHSTFLNDPTSTDVITFPGDPTFHFAGEIIISVDHAYANAQNYGTSLSEEIMLYIIHGYLHLAGLNDDTVESVSIMREAEQMYLKTLKKNHQLPTFTITV